MEEGKAQTGETGNKTTWSYKKYTNGKCELYTRTKVSYNFNLDATKQFILSNEFSISLPFDVYAKRVWTDCTDGQAFSTSTTLNANPTSPVDEVRFKIWREGYTDKEYDYYVDILVKGLWTTEGV